MNKNFFIAFTGMLLICPPVITTQPPPAAMQVKIRLCKKYLAAFNTINNSFQTGDVSKIDNVVSGDFLDHTDKGDVKGKDSLKSMITTMHNNFKDMKMGTKNEAASGDYVYGWMDAL
jgi:SnoaL-like polyketide cyclase